MATAEKADTPEVEALYAKTMREGFWRMVQRINKGIPGFVGTGEVSLDGQQFNGGLAGMKTAWVLIPGYMSLFEAVPSAGFYLMGMYWPEILRHIGVYRLKHDNSSKAVERLEKEFGRASVKSLKVGTIPVPPKSKRRKKMASPELGRLDDPSIVRYVRHILDQLDGLEEIPANFWKDVQRRRGEEPRLDTYAIMNALGNMYGIALARDQVEQLLGPAEASDEEAVMAEAARIIETLPVIAREVYNRMTTFDPAVILMAYQEVGGAAPVQFDVQEEIGRAMESYGGKGVYFNDFHWDVISVLMEVNALLERMLIEHGVPEDVVFHREGAFNFFMPRSVLSMDPQDRRIMAEDAVADANRTIRALVHYGPRNVPLPENPWFTVIGWANGSKSWFIDHGNTDWAIRMRRQGMRAIPLDANFALIPYPTFIVQGILPMLEEHPLYALSLQAKEREEEVEPTDSNVIRILGRFVERARPYGSDAEKDDLRRDLIGLLFRAKHQNDAAAAQQFDEFTKTLPGPIAGYLSVIGRWLAA